MPRQPRIQYPDAIYHITVRGNERRTIFTNDDDRWTFLNLLEKSIRKHHLLCYAYCLMNNHFHLLIETPEGNIAQGMKELNGFYAQYFNKTYERVGHLFQNRYHSTLIEKELHLLESARYVVLNPVRAGLVKHPGEWYWSSYNMTANPQKMADWLQTEWLLNLFAKEMREASRAYRQFVREGMSKNFHKL